ncbi:MAG: hypothetical protein EORIYHIE_002468 [Candidatus Fervidibacter sp.]|jgi:hypothetical protein
MRGRLNVPRTGKPSEAQPFRPDHEGTVERRVLGCGFWVNGVTKALRDEVLQNEAQLNCSWKLMCL